MMRAQIIDHFGDASVFKTSRLPKPQLKPGHVLINVHATSVNPVDFKIRSGLIHGIAPIFPAVLHGDVAGTIEEVGEGVEKFKIGDEVYGCAGGVRGESGALADYMLADEKLLAKKPTSLKMREAASLPLVSITAWEALFDKGNLSANKSVLVHGGTGGVGHITMQIAHAFGAKVFTTISSNKKKDIVKNLNADIEVINYRNESVQDYVNRLTNGVGFDLVVDTIGGENLERSFAAMRLYGTVITILAGNQHDLSQLQAKSGSLHVVFMLLPLLYNFNREKHGEILEKIARMVDNNQIRPLVDPHQFSFADVDQAHAYLESGKAIGKVVISKH